MPDRSTARVTGLARVQTICGPALTGATISWGALFLLAEGSDDPLPGAQELPWLWVAILAVGFILAHLPRLPSLVASISSILLGTSLFLSYFTFVAYTARYAGEKAAAAPNMIPLFFMMDLIVVALTGLLWFPIVLLSWHRHRTRALAHQRVPAHA